jgi:hypothetical protein
MHKTERHRPKEVGPKRDPEVYASVVFLVAEFIHKASRTDFSLLAQTLADWAEHDEIEDWFTTCVMKTFGVPVLPLAGKRPLTLAQLRKRTLQQGVWDREEFVAAHLDLVTADNDERAFLVTCQKVFREIGDTPGYRVGRVAPKIAEMAQLLLEESLQAGVKLVSQRTRRKSRTPRQLAPRGSKARLAAA